MICTDTKFAQVVVLKDPVVGFSLWFTLSILQCLHLNLPIPPLPKFSHLNRSIGCESDPTDELGLNIYLWTLIRLVDVWVDEDNECGPIAHEQMVRVCNHGRVPLPKLLRLPLTPAPASSAAAGVRGEGRGGRSAAAGAAAPWGVGKGAHGSVGEAVGVAVGRGDGAKEDDQVDSGSILAPLMAKLMETGHVEEFVDQVSECFRPIVTAPEEARSKASVQKQHVDWLPGRGVVAVTYQHAAFGCLLCSSLFFFLVEVRFAINLAERGMQHISHRPPPTHIQESPNTKLCSHKRKW